MFLIVLGIILIIIGILLLIKGKSKKEFYKKVKDGKISDYVKTIGTVICDAYHITDVTEVVKAVTPIVEYEVNNEKYETQNSILDNGAELPVGTEVYVWYRKDNPKIAVLGTELRDYTFNLLLGIFLIAIGLLFVINYI